MKQTIKLCMLAAILALCGSATQRVTPYEWFKWTSPGSQLSLRGGVLETEMGQFFRKWVVDEGLLPDNYRPEGEEVLFYANSRQRTFATAKYFSAGFLPFANVEITHKLKEDKMDPVFTPQFTKMNDTYRQQVRAEMEKLNGGPKAWMEAQKPTLELMEQVLDMAHSPAAKNDTTHFWFDGTQFKIEKGDEPKMTGGYTLADAIEDVPSAIRVVANTDAASQPAVIYNLQGQRLNSPQRGINIVGGEKMFVE